MTELLRVTRIRVPGPQGPQGIQGEQGEPGTPGEATPEFIALVGQAQADARNAADSRDEAEVFATEADASAEDAAQSAATAVGAMVVVEEAQAWALATINGFFADTAAGISGTSVGEYFLVIGTGDTLAFLYLHDTGDIATLLGQAQFTYSRPIIDPDPLMVFADANNAMLGKFAEDGGFHALTTVETPIVKVEERIDIEGSTMVEVGETISRDLYSFTDANGNVVARITEDGVLLADTGLNGLTIRPDVLVAFVDSLNRLFGYFDNDGGFYASKGFGLADRGLIVQEETTVSGDLIVFADSNNKALIRVLQDGTLVAEGATGGAGPSEVIAARGSRAVLDDRISAHLGPYGRPLYRWGEERLRETKQRIACLRYGETRQLHIASIGDSFTQNYARYTGPLATYLMTGGADLGDAGGGWTGFGFSGSILNGNARPAIFGLTRTGSWTSHYALGSPAQISPDLSEISSSTATDKLTLTGPALPVLSLARLFFRATADGVVRYRWNAGSWTSLNVQGVLNALTTADLAGLPGSGTWTLEIEVVSGTVTLCGLFSKSTADGVLWSNLGSTGSQAAHWAAANATQWQAGITSLAPDLITVMLGTNDQGALRDPDLFAADLTTILGNCRLARPAADLFVIMPPENQRTGLLAMSVYTAAAIAVADQHDAAFLDLQPYFGIVPSDYSSTSTRPWWSSDGVHPDPTTGGRAMAGAIANVLLYS